MRACVFCGARANSREHVIARSVLKRAGLERLPIDSGTFHEERGLAIRQPHSLEQVTVRNVCRDCNHGWMRALEETFLEVCGELIEPQWPENAADEFEKIFANKEILTRWLFKTAITFRLSTDHTDFFSKDVCHGLAQGQLPPDVWMDMGLSRTFGVFGSITQQFNVVKGGVFQQLQMHNSKAGFRFTLQLNHFLLRILRTPGARPAILPGSGKFPIVVYPEEKTDAEGLFVFDDASDFDSISYLETWRGFK